MSHLLVDISAHGYGHIAQTAPVVNELARRLPNVQITVRSAASTDYLRQRFTCTFRHIPVALDFGMAMFNAVEVDVQRSLVNYREYHANWEEKVESAAVQMRALKPDLLLANVPYLSLAAADAAKIPAVAMCCLNWADIYSYYAQDDAESRAIHAQMLAAYNSAQIFFKVQPTMPMPDLCNARQISPIAKIGVGTSLQAKTGIASKPDTVQHEIKWVLVAMGGIDYRLPMEGWPHIPGVCWLIPQAWNIRRDDIIAFESLDMNFSDVLASCDAVLTKPGYGTFAEAAFSGVPVVYVARGDWPEAPYLVQWLRRHGVCLEVQSEELKKGALGDILNQAIKDKRPPLLEATGASEVADNLCQLMM